jgi:hypothetical protein
LQQTLQQRPNPNNGLDPLQPPLRNALPLFIKIRLHSQPPKFLHDPSSATDHSLPLAPPQRKTRHLDPLILLLILFFQQQQQQRRNLHLLLHAHLDPDIRNLLATRICAGSSPARLLLQRGGEGGVGLCSFGWEGEAG